MCNGISKNGRSTALRNTHFETCGNVNPESNSTFSLLPFAFFGVTICCPSGPMIPFSSRNAVQRCPLRAETSVTGRRGWLVMFSNGDTTSPTVMSPTNVSVGSSARPKRMVRKFGVVRFWRKMRSSTGSPVFLPTCARTSDPLLGPSPRMPSPSE